MDIHSDILEDPIIAKNGVIYLLDQVLECDCKIKESWKQNETEIVKKKHGFSSREMCN